MKPVIICIVGASGSGKTLASMILQEQFGWKAIVSYTTRPMRAGEIDGLDHWFVTPDKKPNQKKICAYTQFGGYEYWTTWDQFNNLFPSVYVIDEKGLIDLQSKETSPFPFQLFTIKLKRSNLETIDEDRKKRDKERVQIPDELYDCVVCNNGSIEELKDSLYLIAQSIIPNLENNGSTTD